MELKTGDKVWVVHEDDVREHTVDRVAEGVAIMADGWAEAPQRCYATKRVAMLWLIRRCDNELLDRIEDMKQAESRAEAARKKYAAEIST